MYLHILWVLFTLLGFVLFGVMPATTALFSVIRKSIEGDRETSIFYTFFSTYKKYFLKSNVLGLLMASLGIFLYIDLTISKQMIQSFYIHAVLLVVCFLYFITVLYYFPVFVRYDFRIFKYIKQSFLISLARPFETIAMIVSLVLLYYLFNLIPPLLFFAGSAIIAYPLMWFAYRAFSGIEGKNST